MVEIQAKTGANYLKAYRQLVERTKAFDQSAVDSEPNSRQVLVDQMVTTGMSSEPTRLILKGSLQSGPVLAPSGAISLESIPCEQYSHSPSTKLEFQPSGPQLRVVESYFESNQAQGQKRTFTVNFSTGAVSDLKQESITRVLPGSLDGDLRSQLLGMASDIDNFSYTMKNPNFSA